MDTVNIQFPNSDPYPIDVDIIKKWIPKEHKIISDYIYFWIGDSPIQSNSIYIGMGLDDFQKVFGYVP